MRTLFTRALDNLLHTKTRPNKYQDCPICGKQAIFSACILDRSGKGHWRAFASLLCEHCKDGVEYNGLDPIPDWLLEEKEEAERRQNKGK